MPPKRLNSFNSAQSDIALEMDGEPRESPLVLVQLVGTSAADCTVDSDEIRYGMGMGMGLAVSAALALLLNSACNAIAR